MDVAFEGDYKQSFQSPVLCKEMPTSLHKKENNKRQGLPMLLEDGTTDVLSGLKETPSRIFLEANLRIYCPGFMKVHIMLDCRGET